MIQWNSKKNQWSYLKIKSDITAFELYELKKVGWVVLEVIKPGHRLQIFTGTMLNKVRLTERIWMNEKIDRRRAQNSVFYFFLIRNIVLWVNKLNKLNFKLLIVIKMKTC